MSSRFLSIFRNQWRGVTAVCLLTLVIGFSLAGSTPVRALSTTTVNTTVIENDLPNDSVCDLWEALQAIADYNNNADTDGNGSIYTYNDCSTGPGPHVIVFTGPAAGGTIRLNPDPGNELPAALPWVTDNVTLTGPVVIDGNGGTNPNTQVNSPIFHTNAGGKLTLLNLVVQNGYTSGAGGAILSLGGDDEINIIGSSIQNNEADGRGGAISAQGKVNILASNFSGNKALGTDGGWGDAAGEGGAIYQSGYNTLNISLSNFAGNIATEGGGAIYTGADSGEISDTVFNGNIVDDDAPTEQTDGGGAIYNNFNDEDEGGLTIIRSVFNGNLSFEAPGGAIFNAGDGFLHVRDSSFNGNIAGDLTNEEMGGAIYNQEMLDIRRVTFMANVSSRGNGGAVANDRTGEATFANVTFTGNGAPDGDGGAIWNGNTQQGGPASITTLYNVTLSLNLSPNAGSAIFNQSDGYHEVRLANTIVDGTGDACNEGLTSQGYNIDSGDTCGLTQGTDQQNTDPNLDTPSFNGGPLASLLTQALNSGSPAIDAGNNNVCDNEYVENLDQRSDPRPKGPTCDIGAFEADPAVPAYGSDPVQPGPIMVGNTSVGTPVSTVFTMLSVGNATLQVDNPTFGGANPAEFSIVSPAFPQSISAGGNEDVTVQCDGSAVGDPTATLTFSTNAPATPSVTYNLECHVEALPVPGYGSDPNPDGTLDFGEIYVGEFGSETLTFFETGNAILTVGGADLSGANPGDFTFNAFDGTINNGEPPVDLPITCTPSDYGLRTAVFSLTTNDPQQPTVSYNLVCEGIPLPPAPLATPGISYVEGQGGLNTLDGAYDVAISPDGVNAYVTGFNDDALTVFRRNAETGVLTLTMSISNVALDGPQMVEVSPDGTQVYVTARNSDAFIVFNRSPASGNVTTGPIFQNGQDGITGMDYPYGIVISPDGRFIYVTGYLSDAIVTFSRDSDGAVAYEDTLVDVTNLYSPYVPTISPDGQHLYVTGGTGAADNGYVSVFARNVLDGTLTFVQRRYEGQCFFLICINGLGEAWGIAVSPDGNHVYVAGYEDDAVVRFIRDPFDGTLIYGGYITNSSLQLTGEETAVTEQSALDESVSGGQTVELMEALNTEGLNGARDVKVSPDGTYVYVTGAISDALSVFGRNPANGILTQVQVIYAAGNNPALNGAWEIGVSPDGTAVYATGNVNDSVVAFHTANPVPTLDTLLPASAVAGSGNLTIRVLGQNFVPGVVGQMNGVARNTEYISPNEIEVELNAADLVNPGTRAITAMNPSPGGGPSVNSLDFTVTAPNENPIPSIDYLQPGGAPAGDPAFTLTVFGANFVNGAAVQWNGENRATTFVSSTELRVTIPAGDLLIPGVAAVTAVNPGPGGGTSNAVTFDVAAPGQNPVPTITGVNPHHTFARGAASNPFTIQVSGLNFIPGVQAQWNGQNRPTQFVNETTLLVTLNSFDVAFGGSGSVTAVNPGPGGGVSNPATFTIYPYAIFLPLTRN